MRISTVTMFEQSVSSLNRQQSGFIQVGQQIASGKRVVNPSDDPQASSRAVAVSQSAALNQQYADARITTRNALGQEESVLNSVAYAITSAKTLLVQARNGTLSDADRSSIASELKGIYETLIGQANAADGNGRYLFGGYKDAAPPFVKDADGKIIYEGDLGVPLQQVDASRQMPSTDHGKAIFQSVHSSAGYVAQANEWNSGNLTFTGPSVQDAATASGFTLDFLSVAGEMHYQIDGADQGPYTAGMSLSVNGLYLTLEGTPVDGDSIVISKAQEADPNLFRTLESAISALDTPVAGDEAGVARMKNTLSLSMRELDNALDNVLTVRASAGARLNELDMVDSVGTNRKLNYVQTLSDLIDLDYYAALSDYSLRQIGLQAAQKAFVDIQGSSLFKLL